MADVNETLLLAREIQCERIGQGGAAVRIHVPEAVFPAGTLTILQGATGAESNLLLRILGLLEQPDSGDVIFRGNGTRQCSREERAVLRNRNFGYCFSEPFLLPGLSVVENIAMPVLKDPSISPDDARELTRAALSFAGMMDLAEEAVDPLSHYQQSLIALARAVVRRPPVLLVEEADHQAEGIHLNRFMEYLSRVPELFGVTVILSVSSSFAGWPGSRRIDPLSVKGSTQDGSVEPDKISHHE